MTVLCLSTIFLASCQERLSGDSEIAFNTSREKLEATLTPQKQETLEKALRVVALHAMTEKWEHPDTYDGKSFNDISLALVDGKSYRGLVRFAEDYLEKENQLKIEKLQEEAEELKSARQKADSMLKVLEVFKPAEISIVEGTWDTPTIGVKVMNGSTFTCVLRTYPR